MIARFFRLSVIRMHAIAILAVLFLAVTAPIASASVIYQFTSFPGENGLSDKWGFTYASSTFIPYPGAMLFSSDLNSYQSDTQMTLRYILMQYDNSDKVTFVEDRLTAEGDISLTLFTDFRFTAGAFSQIGEYYQFGESSEGQTDWVRGHLSVREESTPVPEPATIIFLATGLLGLGGYLWKRKTLFRKKLSYESAE